MGLFRDFLWSESAMRAHGRVQCLEYVIDEMGSRLSVQEFVDSGAVVSSPGAVGAGRAGESQLYSVLLLPIADKCDGQTAFSEAFVD